MTIDDLQLVATSMPNLNLNANILQANQHHFNTVAQRYDERACATALAQKSARAMLEAYPFREGETDVLDYACGTGLVSRELAAYTRSVLGVDVSQGMVDQYNLRVYNQGILQEEMHATCAELEGKDDELGGRKFDVVICASAYHHIQSIERVTKVLTHFLRPSGALLVVDLEKTDADIHDSHRHMVAHPGGIDRDHLEHAFRYASLESFSYERAFDARLNGAPVTLFIAKGLKPVQAV